MCCTMYRSINVMVWRAWSTAARQTSEQSLCRRHVCRLCHHTETSRVCILYTLLLHVPMPMPVADLELCEEGAKRGRSPFLPFHFSSFSSHSSPVLFPVPPFLIPSHSIVSQPFLPFLCARYCSWGFVQILSETAKFFTALHRMQTRSDNSVCLSVRPSVRLTNAWIVTKRKKNVSRFLCHTKDHLS